MPVSLAEAKNNTQTDYDPYVIDEFRKESVILDSLVFDDAVNPAGGGATLTYGYRRQVTQPTAATREINKEYAPQEVTTAQKSTNLAVMGGSFEVDRVLGDLGPAASGAVNFQLSQKIKATRTKFQDLVINGDVASDANGFDGLDKALTGSSTEFKATSVTDWSTLNTAEGRLSALDALDEFLSLLEQRLADPVFVELSKHTWRATSWEPDDPRLDALAAAVTDNLLHHLPEAPPAGFQGHADTRERVALINRHREEELPTLARLGALIEAKLREAGVDVPYR